MRTPAYLAGRRASRSDWSGPGPGDAAWLGLSAYERALWDLILHGRATAVPLHVTGGGAITLDVPRYAGSPDEADGDVLARCSGPTLDIGCGPGRMAAALSRRGVQALGIDIVPAAVLLARAAGATVLCASVFDPLPGEGLWSHALLIDGNIGIGGDPAALLERTRALLRPGGTLVAEVEPVEIDERHEVRLDPGGPVLPWTRVGAGALCAAAAPAGYRIRHTWRRAGRRFVELAPC